MIEFVKNTFQEWNRDDAPRLAASLAFYTSFSAAPFFILLITLAGRLFGESAAQGQVVNYLSGFIGAQSAQLIQNALAGAEQYRINTIDLLLGAGGLVIGTSSVILQLQSAFNKIWNLSPGHNSGLKRTLRRRVLSIGVVLVVGLIIIVALVADTLIPSLEQVAADSVPGGSISIQIINQVVSFGLMGLLLAALYKVVPDAEVGWRHIAVGATVTAILFTIGKILIGLYLSRSLVVSIYQAGSSLMALLIWIYYSSLILFLGAEIIKVSVQHSGGKIDAPVQD